MKKFVNMYDLITGISSTCDLVSNEITNHHKKVAYMAFRIAEGYGLPTEQQREVFLAGLLHDLGAFSPFERIKLLDKETAHVHHHAFIGSYILDSFQPLKNMSWIIKFHHLPWRDGKGGTYEGGEVPLLSHILHLADRIVVQIDMSREIIGQVDGISRNIRGKSGLNFHPKLVEAYLDISSREYIWLDTILEPLMTIMPGMMNLDILELTIDEVVDLAKIFAQLIDFRSPFTARHSSGVAVVSAKLAEMIGFSENECKMMLIAGYLHDLGKLAVGKEILEKPGKLETEEMSIMKSHSFYTYRTLQAIKGFETINLWASLHHEKLNGEGYPFHYKSKDIPLGSRVMAAADIFTAITENRPYRNGMSKDKALKTMSGLVDGKSICPVVFSVISDNFDELNGLRYRAQEVANTEYRKIESIKYPINNRGNYR